MFDSDALDAYFDIFFNVLVRVDGIVQDRPYNIGAIQSPGGGKSRGVREEVDAHGWEADDDAPAHGEAENDLRVVRYAFCQWIDGGNGNGRKGV